MVGRFEFIIFDLCSFSIICALPIAVRHLSLSDRVSAAGCI